MNNTNLTKKEFMDKFETVKIQAFNIFFANSPYKTGNLRSKIILTYTDSGFVITNDVEYMESTEEKYGWFKKSMEQAFNYIVREMSI